MAKALVLVVASFLLAGCYTTQNSIGTATFQQSRDTCSIRNSNVFKCLRTSPDFVNFTQAEKEMIAYMIVIDEKRLRGEITRAEADLIAAQYMSRAIALGAASERAQAAEVSAALNNLSQNLNAAAAAQAEARRSIPSIPSPVQTRCWRSGMYVNCTSY